MATQDVDFKVGDGTGTNDSGNPGTIYPDAAAGIAATKVFSPGERVRAVVFNRPLENLRKRTETLKVETETQKYLQDTDMRWIITGGTAAGLVSGHGQPYVTWVPANNEFTISADIVLQPIAGPKTDKKGSITYVKAANWSITLSTDLYRFQEGHKLSIRWQEADPSTLPLRVTAETLFEPYPTLVITLCDDGTTTIGDVTTALNTLAGAGGFTHVTSGSGYVLLGDILVDGIANPFYDFAATYDRELHHIPASTFAAFFATESILSGDTLCLSYEWLVNPDGVTYSGRRQATESSGTSTVSLPGQLFLADAHPDRLPLSIPICRRLGDDLFFIDGTIARGDEVAGVYFGTNGYTTQTFNSTTAPSGATLIGVSANTHAAGHKSADVFNIAAGTLQATLVLLQTFINDKASLDADETVDGAWVYNNTAYTYDPAYVMSTYNARLIWRTGYLTQHRPADAQVAWNTISKYGIFFNNEVFYLTIQGGYIEYYGSKYVIHTPSTGTGNVYVNIDSVGSLAGYEANANVRGSRRIYDATANTRYDLIPTNWLTDSLSGDIYSGDMRMIWATVFTLNTTTAYITATNIVTTVSTMSYTPTYEAVTVGAAMAVHPAPTLLAVATDVLGTHKHSFFNRVLEGFAVVPADLVLHGSDYSAGEFGIDVIRVMGGRAIVAGSIITIPEMRTLTGVVSNYFLPNTTTPVSSADAKWYGLWLRRDGVFRVGPLPQCNLGLGVPGHNQYMLPVANIESPTYDVHDYTLVNLVWSYQGNVANQIRFAGIMHMGGNLWMFHQARRGNYMSPPSFFEYVEHRFAKVNNTGTSPFEDETMGVIDTSYDAVNNNALGLPGVPAALTTVALLSVSMRVHLENSGNYAGIYLLSNNYPTADSGVYSSSLVAPPNLINPATVSPEANVDCDNIFVIGSPPADYYTSVLFKRYAYSHTASIHMTAEYDDTVMYPAIRPSDLTNAATGLVQVGTKYSVESPEELRINVRTLGFVWDRYNVGGIVL